MRKKDGKWIVTNLSDLFGWESIDGEIGVHDSETGLTAINMVNKKTKEVRKFYSHPMFLPAASLERNRDLDEE